VIDLKKFKRLVTLAGIVLSAVRLVRQVNSIRKSRKHNDNLRADRDSDLYVTHQDLTRR
jgi:hypothetical protein